MNGLRNTAVRSGVAARRCRNRNVPAIDRSLSTSTNLNARSSASSDPFYTPAHPLALPIPASALSSLASRLSLPPTAQVLDALTVCLTDPTFDPVKVPNLRKKKGKEVASVSVTTTSDNPDETVVEADAKPRSPSQPSNTLLSSLGNSLLGMFTSEHLSTLYPNLPTRVLKAATTAYAGPAACFSVGRELGVGVTAGSEVGNPGKAKSAGMSGAGILVKWIRPDGLDQAELEAEKVSSSSASLAEGGPKVGKRRIWEDVVADTVRAFVGLVYQERGIHAARTFVHAHFLSRHVDLASLLNFRNPKHVLSVEMRRLIGETEDGSEGRVSARIESRILAESGRHSISPIFLVGLFLPSGIKLAEGHGTSLRMAEHRAAVNALLSIYLVRGELLAKETARGDRVEDVLKKLETRADESKVDLPTSVHRDFPLEVLKAGEREKDFVGNVTLGRAEVVFGSKGLSRRNA